MDHDSLADRRAVIRVPAGHDAFADATTDAAAAGDETATADEDVTVARVGPTGIGALDPLVTATADGETAFYADPGVDLTSEVAADLADGTVGATGDPLTVVDHDPDAATLPVPEDTALGVGLRRLLRGAGWHRPTDPGDHAAAGGFADAGLEDVVTAADGLVGRGWGDWCHDEDVSPTLDRARDAFGDVAVVVNAHGTAADALLAESVPFSVLEGADLLATALDAERVVLYLSEADETARERIETAAERYSDPETAFEVVAGPAVHRATEPTMALEAIEGNHRLEARLRRPGELPVLNGAPALVHTARTVAHLFERMRAGASGNDPTDHGDTRFVTVTGDVETPATVELPEREALETALEAVSPTDGCKAAAVGGRFGGLTDSLDVSVGSDALAEAGLGTDGVVEILGEDRCLVEFAGRRAQLAADTNCGRCVPCREGATQLTELLRDIYDGDYDEDGIAELLRVMDDSSVCAFGVEAARPARTAIDAFDGEFEAHAEGRCPAGACFEPPEVPQ